MRSIKFVAGACLLALVAFSLYAIWSGSTPLVSLVLGAYVLGMGWLVASYSARNLYGQPRLGRFAALLALTIGALWVLVVAQPIWLTALAWTVSGLAVAGLVAHSGAARARSAARRVAGVMLVGDLALWVAVAILLSQGFATRSELAGAGWMVPALLLIAGIVRSALFPAWRWLPLTAEAPSPVSALLHAGVVNGTGLLAMLWWPVFAAAPAVLVAFVGIGLLTAVLGTAAMRVRPDVKGRLASSTSAQMGYMAVQIGLGLPAFAMLHLIGHGFYKAWLFLRAGGAPGRPEIAAPSNVSKTGVALLAIPTALSIAVATLTWSSVPVVDLVPLAVAGAAGLAALVALAYPGRTLRVVSSPGSRIAAMATVIAGLAGYLIVLGLWSRAFGVPPVFEGVPAVALTAAVLVLGALGLYAAGREGLRSLVRGVVIDSRIRGRVPHIEVGSPQSAGPAVDAVSGLVGPMWPIRSAVAVNPLHGMQSLPFGDAAQIAERTWRARSYLTEDLYAQALRAGRFTADDVVAASEGQVLSPRHVADYLQARVNWEPSVAALEATEQMLHDIELPDAAPDVPTLGELAGVADQVSALSNGWASLVIAEPSLWVAFQDRVRDHGLRGLRATVQSLPADPDLAIGALLADRVSQDVVVGYLAALTARDPGWVAHVQQREPALLPDLLAIRVAFDVLVAGSRGVHALQSTAQADKRDRAIAEVAAVVDILGIRDPHLALRVAASLGERQRCAIWQRAWEQRYANRLVDRATTRAQQTPEPERSDAQVVMCIDVRSERMRRHLEATGPIATYGYAGFFGLAIRHESATGVVTDQCPVLIQPQHDVQDARPRPRGGYAQAVRGALVSATRLPGASFAVAEGLGVLAGSDAWAQTAAPGTWGRGRDRLLAVERGTLESGLDAQAGAAAVAAMFRAIGLVEDFAPVILVAGHAATVENNAFAAAYDCGACGGNGGYVNARLMAQLANDPAVRSELLLEHGIDLPAGTLALPAWHNTTTDEVVIDDADVPASHAQVVQQLRTRLAQARDGVLAERMAELPQADATSVSAAHRRASDWAQPQPEFGLAGNAAFVIGPRSITKGLNLRGRVFLHSYEPGLDVDGSILETLLTAPMVVTQWINNQYYFATVDPERFGAGDKTTHNVVGDYGVFTGAGGDLRVGLPWQSTYRRAPGGSLEDLQHEPLRLQVLVYAEPEDIDRVLADHPEVAALLANEWIFLAAIDPRTGQARALDTGLTWRDWLVAEPAHVMEG